MHMSDRRIWSSRDRSGLARYPAPRPLIIVALLTVWLATPAVGQDRARKQWEALALWMSMDQPLIRIVELTGPRAIEKAGTIAQLAVMSLDAHPDLARFGGPHIKFLVGLEARIIPILRAEDFSIEGILAQGLSMMMEEQVAMRWQRELESSCRTTYANLLPFAREIAARANEDSLAPPAYGSSTEIWVKNPSGRTLTRVTLATVLIDIYGRQSGHYFYLRSFDAGKQYKIQIASDWSPGAAGTVALSVEILSEEFSTARHEVELPGNLRRQADQAIAAAWRVVQYRPPDALRHVAALRPRLGSRSHYAGQLTAIEDRAEVLFPIYEAQQVRVKRLQDRIRDLTERRKKMKNLVRRQKTDERRQGVRRKIRLVEGQITKANADIREINQTALRVPGGTVTRSPAEPQDDETKARDALRNARMYAVVPKGRPDLAGKHCELLKEVFTKYPETAAGKQAKRQHEIICGDGPR